MSDLISREKLKDYLDRNISFGGVEKKFAFFDIIDSIPSADIIECARAIKEYCEKYDERCVGCPFNSAKPTKWCELGCSSLPHEWDLPEGGGDLKNKG